MARVLVDQLVGLRHRDRRAPFRRPRRGIVDRELVLQRVRIDAAEALDQVQVLRRAAEPGLLREVGGVHHERVAFPVADRIAGQRSDVRRRVRPPVQRDEAGAVDHLVEDQHGVLRLHQLHVVVVGARDHRRPRVEADDAALGERTLFRVVVLAAPRRVARLRRRRHRRHAAVGRIDDQRRLLRDALAEVPPEVVVGALDVGRGAAAAVVLVAGLDPLLRELFGLLVAERALAGERARALEWRELGEVPRALEVGVAVRRARHLRLRASGRSADTAEMRKIPRKTERIQPLLSSWGDYNRAGGRYEVCRSLGCSLRATGARRAMASRYWC